MKRCMALGRHGLGSTAPNPMVGCVIVHKDHIIGEGFTSPYGGAHAEVNAINSVVDKTLLKHSTLYVTLEPCCHHGKTPPCSDLILDYKIPKIVIGCVDPNAKVSGQGIARLQSRGCEVVVGVEESLCKAHHKRFLTFQTKKRPYIILKWAETQDGFIAPKSKRSKQPIWISGKRARQLVHQWRSEEQAILVGGKTILEDNPSLTTRHVVGSNPTRIVIDTHNNLPSSYKAFDNEADTIRLNSEQLNIEEPIAQEICNQLHQFNIISVVVEGGSKTLQDFIDADLWDEARIFKNSKRFGQGIKGPHLEYDINEKIQLGNDDLYTIFNST